MDVAKPRYLAIRYVTLVMKVSGAALLRQHSDASLNL